MNRAQLATLLRRAHALSGHREFVIVGSLAILGAVVEPPGGVSRDRQRLKHWTAATLSSSA